MHQQQLWQFFYHLSIRIDKLIYLFVLQYLWLWSSFFWILSGVGHIHLHIIIQLIAQVIILKTHTCQSLLESMWAYNWVKSTLHKWGLVNKNAKIVLLGLDNSGKTCLLYCLQDGVIKDRYSTRPLRPPYSQQITVQNVKFTVLDMANYSVKNISGIDGIMFMVDSADKSRFQQSKQQLQTILQMQELKDVPVAVLGNKIDKMHAVSQQQLMKAMGVETTNQWRKGSRPIKIFMCTVAKKMGYRQAFHWFTTLLQ